MAYVGIDLHENAGQVCIYDEETERYIERRVRTDFDGLRRALEKHPGSKVLLEVSTENEWVAQWLEELGFEVIVADSSFAPMDARRNRRIKTDRRDARALCDACRHGVDPIRTRSASGLSRGVVGRRRHDHHLGRLGLVPSPQSRPRPVRHRAAHHLP